MKYYHGAFTQYTRTFYTPETGFADRVVCVAALPDGRFFAAGEQELYLFDGSGCAPLGRRLPEPVRDVFVHDGTLYLAAGRSLYRDFNGAAETALSFPAPIIDAAVSREGVLWVMTETALYKVADGEPVDVNDAPFGVKQIAVRTGDKVFAACEIGLFAKKGKRRHWAELVSEWSGLVSDDVRCVRVDSLNYVWMGTAKGVCVYDDRNAWQTPDTVENLPDAAINDMVFTPDGAKYFAAATGLILLQNGRLRYLTYGRWLPSPCVRTLAVNGDGVIFAVTDAGVSVVTPEKMTLEEKADRFDRLTDRYFTRKGRWINDLHMPSAGNYAAGVNLASDNDGLFTGLYAAAQSFRYAVTGSPDAREKARRSVRALLELTEVSGIDGFIARAVRYADEPDFGAEQNGEWHAVGDAMEWKGETSSDEVTGHMYAYSVYYDLCADAQEKKRISMAVERIMEHILANRYHLIDADGAPTTWANWAPESINGDNKWIFERGINSLEILSYLITAYHITGNETYHARFLALAENDHYALNAMRYKIRDARITHIDDRLGFNTVYPLLLYTQEPDIRSIFLMGLQDHWNYERAERTPLYNFVHAYFTGDGAGVCEGAQTLAEMPLDTANYPVYNSHIRGLAWDRAPEKYGNPAQLASPLSREIAPVCGGAGNPYHCDAGADAFLVQAESSGLFDHVSQRGHDGCRAQSPIYYLQHYWAGRYFGLLGD